MVIAPQLAFILIRHLALFVSRFFVVVSDAIEDGNAGLGETASPFNMRFIYQDREAGLFIPDTPSWGTMFWGSKVNILFWLVQTSLEKLALLVAKRDLASKLVFHLLDFDPGNGRLVETVMLPDQRSSEERCKLNWSRMRNTVCSTRSSIVLGWL